MQSQDCALFLRRTHKKSPTVEVGLFPIRTKAHKTQARLYRRRARIPIVPSGYK